MFLSSLTFGQFSDDPAVNTVVCNLSGSQGTPHIAYDDVGNFYVGFYSNSSGNYNIRLQYFSYNGIAQWATDGILVSSHPQATWLTDWDLTTDNNGNCVLAFNDIRDGNPNIYAYAISPTGVFLWGSNGIQLTSNTADEYAPCITVTGDNNTIVAWTRPVSPYYQIIIQKITPSGTLSWGNSGLIYQSGSYSYDGARILGISGDNFLMGFFKETGSFPGYTRHIYAQKFDGSGSPQWASDVLVSNSNGISNHANVRIAPDNADGIIIAWNDDWDNDNNIDAKAQRVLADGSITWPSNGVETNTTTSTSNQNTRIVGVTDNDDVIVTWDFKNSNQSQTAIAGQNISSTGIRQWTDNGIIFIPMSSSISGTIGGKIYNNNNSIITYEETTSGTNQDIKAIGVDNTGTLVWSPTITIMSSRTTQKLHSVISTMFNDQLIVAWEDGSSSADIFIQNIYYDGSMGDPPLSNDATLSDLTVDGTTVDGFAPDIYVYEVGIPAGNPLPVTDATPNDALATVAITQATAVPGTSSVLVTAEDGTTQLTYTINFHVAGTDATLSDLTIDGTTISGFAPNIFTYDYTVATGNPIPVVGATLTDPLATMILTQAITLPGSATVDVTSEDALTTNTYTVNFLYTPSVDATLADLTVSGITIEGFAQDIYYYEYGCINNGSIPYVYGVPNDPLATLDDTQCVEIPGDAILVVTAEDGITQLTYTVHLFYLGNDVSLSDLTVDGVTIPGFDPQITTYQYIVNDTVNIPVVDGTTTDTSATLTINQASAIPGEASLHVVAEDGYNERTYTVYFYTLAADATLSDLTVDGITISGFDPLTFEYEFDVPEGSPVPIIDGTTTDSLATKVVTQASAIPGEGNILVTAQDGINQLTYSVDFKLITGVVNNNLVEIDIYPNPVDNILNIFNVPVNSNIKIVNLAGIEVYQSAYADKNIDLSNLKKGLYLLIIENNGKIIFTNRIVKK